MEVIPIPTTVEEITASWFSKVLQGAHVKPETFKVVPNAQEGMGFLSVLARVEFETDSIDMMTGESSTKKYNLIVKLIPDSNSFLDWARDIVMEEKLDQVEINAYQTYLPDLIKEVPEIKKHICDFHFAGIQAEDAEKGIPYASALVMEDLRPQGYTTILLHETFPENEFFQGTDFLASLHVAGKCLERRRSATLRQMYPGFPDWLNSKGIPDPAAPKVTGVMTLFLDSFPLTYKFLESNSNSGTALIPKIKMIETKAALICDAILRAGQKFACGLHADFWSHNILVNKDRSKPIKVIDWQLVAYADPVYDLVLYTLTTLPLEALNTEGIAKARITYFNKYEELCGTKNIPLARDSEEFEKFFNTYGLAYGLVCYMISVEPFSNVGPGARAKIEHVFQLLCDFKIPDFMLSIV